MKLKNWIAGILVAVMCLNVGLPVAAEEELAPGLYDNNTGELLYNWNIIIKEDGLEITGSELTSYNSYFFEDCSENNDLKLVLSEEITTIGDKVFWSSMSIDSIVIPSSVTTIGESAFKYSNIENVTMTDSVMSIGAEAFYGCYNLKSITLSNNVEEIKYRTFWECVSLETIMIPDSANSIGIDAFYGCEALKSINNFSGVEQIGDYAFSKCTGLIDIAIPNSVTTIGEGAFNSCDGLKNVAIPATVTFIGNNAFSGKNLVGITIDENNPLYDSRDNCNGIIYTSTNCLVAGCKGTIIPESVIEIGDMAFANNTELTSITIPNGVEKIGESVFGGCSALTNVVLSSEITEIGNGAFAECESLTNINLPEKLVTIGNDVFRQCEKLEEIVIPANVQNIGENVFAYCGGLASISVSEANEIYDSRENCNAVIQTKTNTLVVGCKKTYIPSSVTTIGYKAFCGCENLISLTIPKSVTKIEKNAFEWSDLKEVILPAGLTVIEDSVFDHCLDLQKIELPNSITTIGDYAFYSCENLEAITIPNNVETIGDGVFDGCEKLTSIVFPASIKSIGRRAFFGCWGLKKITFEGSRPEVDYEAFGVLKADGYYPDTWEEEPDPDWGASVYWHKMGEDIIAHFDTLVDEISTNNGGNMYCPIKVTVGNQSVPDGTTVRYKVDNVNETYTGTVKNGVVSIPIASTNISDGSRTITFQSISDGYEIYNNSVTIKVHKKSLSYTETMDMSIKMALTGNLGKILELEKGKTLGVTMEVEEDDGDTTLKLSNHNTDGAKAGSGISTKVNNFKLGLAAGEIKAEKKVTDSLVIENFDTALDEDEQMSAIGYFFLKGLDDSIGKVTAAELQNLYYDMYGEYVTSLENDEEEASVAVKVNKDVTVSGKFNNNKYSLTANGDGVEYKTSVKDNLDNGETTYSSSAATLGGGVLLKGNWLLGLDASIWSTDMSKNATEISVKYKNDELAEVSAAGSEKTYNKITGTEVATTKNSKVSYTQGSVDLLNQNTKLKKLANGDGVFMSQEDIADIYKVMNSSTLLGNVQDNIKYTSALEFGVSEASLKVTVSGEKEYEFETGQGVIYNGIAYETVDNEDNFRSGVTWELGYSAPDMVKLGVQGIGSFLSDAVKYSVGQAVEGVKDKAAEVWSKTKSTWTVIVASINGTTAKTKTSRNIAEPMLLTVEEDNVSKTAVSIGSAYTVKVFANEEKETEVTAEQLNKEPVYLKLDYTEDELESSGVSSSDEADIRIFYWDAEEMVYRPVAECTVNTEENSVTATIPQCGEYILAIDTEEPVVIQYEVSDETPLPKITATVSDFSGVKGCVMTLDGKTVITENNFSDYYNKAEGVIEYQVTEPLSSGTHKTTIVLTDSNGNSMKDAKVLEWTVDGTSPVISDIVIPDYIDADESNILIKAKVKDDNLYRVYANVGEGENAILYKMEMNNTEWTVELENQTFNEELNVTIIAVDEAGNKTSSKTYSVKRQNNNTGFGTEDVYRIFGANRYETSFTTADVYKAQLGVDKFKTVIVACGTNFADALAGSYLAGVKNAPILMANNKDASGLVSYISKNLKSGGTIYILGGTNAVSAKIESSLKSYGTIKRLGGANRYETNLLILKEAGVTNQDIIVCTATGFADSLSASAVGRPILLVGKKLTADQKTYLKGLSGNKYYVIGGTSAVNTTVESEIKAYGTTKRIGGANRYETSVLVAETFFDNPKTAVLAYAKNFPDGLSGGPLAMSKNAPLILTMTGKESTAASYTSANGITKGAVLGGTGLISDSAAKKVFSADKINVW